MGMYMKRKRNMYVEKKEEKKRKKTYYYELVEGLHWKCFVFIYCFK